MDTIWPETLPKSAGPKYRAVSDTIRRAVESGQLEVGARLPPVRELAYRLGITPGTVARAYSVLTDEGVLQAEVGRGTYVAAPEAEEGFPLVADVIPHGSEGGDGYHVNLFAPHLPEIGQARLIRKLLMEVAQDPPSGLMHYPSVVAERPLRAAAAQWLQGVLIGAVREQDVVLANGGQNAVVLILQAVLKGRRPTVLVEELAYPGFRRAAELLRADVVPVAMDEHGLIPEALEAAARGHDAQILCTSPEAHNPTLLATQEPRRRALVEAARRADLQILEDNCYVSGAHVAPSYRVLAPERTWYVSSISKSVSPSLRLGFGLAPPGQTGRLRRVAEQSFFGLATPISDLAAKLLAHPDLAALEHTMLQRVGEYVQIAVNTLGVYDLAWRADLPFLWLTLPEGWRAGAFCQAAEARGVRVRSSEDFTVRSGRAPHAVRMAVNAGVSLATFESAMTRLRDLLDNPPEQISV
ncbi:PLP-dependent aminotransferase family protein [Seohaeicola saemankumensis]|nr:PLP-dependent aminotransferase family protein [Seohaeicola saemankumensis]MCA0872102.1 PLP-dependent aminotransferase family protein [Seohaeicola saemankumensis]